MDTNDALYGNIAYPLSNTLCSGESHPQATVATHLARLAEELDLAEDKVKALSRDWDACLNAENKAWAELSNGSCPRTQIEDISDAFGTGESALFRKEAQDIFSANVQIVEDIEEVRYLSQREKHNANNAKGYKEQIRTETAKILQHMMG